MVSDKSQLFLSEHTSDFLIKIGINLLGGIEEIVFSFCFSFGLSGRNASSIRKNPIVVKGQEFVNACSKLFHIKHIATFNLSFYVIEIRSNGAFKLTNFFLCEIVLGY